MLNMKNVSEPDTTPESVASEQAQFTQLVAAGISRFHADLQVVVVGDLQLHATLPTGMSVAANLANLLAAGRNEPDQVKTLLEDYCHTLAGIECSLEKPRLDQIVPLIKTRPFVARLSGEVCREDQTAGNFATETLTEELSILYAVNSDKP
jgi:hypothetical protein